MYLSEFFSKPSGTRDKLEPPSCKVYSLYLILENFIYDQYKIMNNSQKKESMIENYSSSILNKIHRGFYKTLLK